MNKCFPLDVAESQEAPRSPSPDWASLSDDELEEEDEVEVGLQGGVLEHSHPLVPALGPLPQAPSTLPPAPPLLLGRRGAFTSYVRRRGEPDGRYVNFYVSKYQSGLKISRLIDCKI